MVKYLGVQDLKYLEIIDKLCVKKRNGVSHVSIRLLKFINNEEREIIANRFNKFLVEGYPEILKIRKLLGLPKPSGEARLVSVDTCVMGSLTKLYDINLKNRLESYIMPKIPKEQTAYQYDRRGCEENIFVTKILTEMFGNKLIMLVTDFSKAFKSVTKEEEDGLKTIPSPLFVSFPLA